MMLLRDKTTHKCDRITLTNHGRARSAAKRLAAHQERLQVRATCEPGRPQLARVVSLALNHFSRGCCLKGRALRCERRRPFTAAANEPLVKKDNLAVSAASIRRGNQRPLRTIPFRAPPGPRTGTRHTDATLYCAPLGRRRWCRCETAARDSRRAPTKPVRLPLITTAVTSLCASPRSAPSERPVERAASRMACHHAQQGTFE